jgi:hypothetical protein
MDFQMQIDNPRKRCRDDFDYCDMVASANGDLAQHDAKRFRQWDANALLLDAPQTAESTSALTTPSLSAVSTPASVPAPFADADVDMDVDLTAPAVPSVALHQPQHQPQMQPQQPQPQQQQQQQQQEAPRPQSNLIAGWNAARRAQYLSQGYPLAWVQGTVLAVSNPQSRSLGYLTCSS